MALSHHYAANTRPMNIEQIVKQAQDFEFVPNRTLKAWLRSAQMLLTEAAICEQDGNLQMAYLFLLRHAELILSKLPSHPQFRDPGLKVEVGQAQKTVQRNLSKLEKLKPRVQAEYDRYVKAKERREQERQRVQAERDEDERQRRWEDEYGIGAVSPEDGAYDDREQALNAREHQQLAVDLARRELRRRDANKQSTRQAGISPGEVASRRQGIVVNDLIQRESAYEDVREAGQHLYPARQPSRQAAAPHQQASTAYHYPSVPAKEGVIDWRTQQTQQPHALQPPTIPTKEEPHQPPILPPKPTLATPDPAPPSTKSRYTFAPQAYTESGAPLRTIMLPPDLRTTFLNLAHPNTARNLETCGILCGTVVSNALFISHLIIPDQNSTSDTCDTTEAGDNNLFDYCDSHSLLVMGWIHTHPSQSCFLSSRDLHTSSGYQVMLPEAIAIVCAPRHNPDWGIFRLTDPPGLQHVLKCEKQGLFHLHEEGRLYTDADCGERKGRGHVVEAKGLEFQVVDLRGRK